MPPPDFQINLPPSMTSTFDLLTPKVDRFMSSLHGPLLPIGIKIGLFRFQNTVFTSLVADERMNGRTDNPRT